MEKIRKKGLNYNVIFFVLMGFFFVFLLFFSLNKIFFLQEEISEQDLQFLKIELEKSFETCTDPLRRESSRIINLENKEFNSVCILRENYLDTVSVGEPLEWETIKEGGDNVVLMKTTFADSTLIDYTIVGSLKLNIELPAGPSGSSNHICWYDLENTGDVYIEIVCS